MFVRKIPIIIKYSFRTYSFYRPEKMVNINFLVVCYILKRIMSYLRKCELFLVLELLVVFPASWELDLWGGAWNPTVELFLFPHLFFWTGNLGNQNCLCFTNEIHIVLKYTNSLITDKKTETVLLWYCKVLSVGNTGVLYDKVLSEVGNFRLMLVTQYFIVRPKSNTLALIKL